MTARAKARVRQALRRVVLEAVDDLAYDQRFAACLARSGLSRHTTVDLCRELAERTRLRGDWRSQRALIEDLPRVDIDS